MSDIANLRAEVDRTEREAQEARDRLNEALWQAMEAGGRGTQARLSKEANVSRETLRKLRVPYRSITRYEDDGRALITMPADNVHPDRSYEIRDTDGKTVLAVVPGQDILDARAEQLAEYLQEVPTRTNIRMVDVTHLLPANDA